MQAAGVPKQFFACRGFSKPTLCALPLGGLSFLLRGINEIAGLLGETGFNASAYTVHGLGGFMSDIG